MTHIARDMPKKVRKRIILDSVEDLVTALLVKDREDDDVLPIGEIEAAVFAGDMSSFEMVSRFKETLQRRLMQTMEAKYVRGFSEGAEELE